MMKYVAEIAGDLVLGGLMMVHERGEASTCGPIMPQGGVQALETMVYTLQYANAHPTLLPGLKIGAHILDDCDKDTYGLEQSIDFIKGKLRLNNKYIAFNNNISVVRSLAYAAPRQAMAVSEGSISNIDDGEYQCPDGTSPQIRNQVNQVISGVVGAASSVTSIQVANLLRLFKIPQRRFVRERDRPPKYVAEIAGDLVLGGLMMVHERGEASTCGPIMPQGGVQALETMVYTLQYANAHPTLLPGLKIGAHILDDCDKDTYGLEQSIDFIKGSISNIDDGEYQCPDGTSPQIRNQVNQVISGVVGAASSVTSIQVANLLRLFKIPQVSFFSTSPELSSKQRFEYFSRTIPSDEFQVKAMVEIVKRLGWTYVSIIYEESNYGIKAFEALEGLLAENNICIAVKEKLKKDSGVAKETAYDTIVQRLLSKERAKGVIVFGSDQEVAGVMRAVRRMNATGRFSWIGSDGWSARSLVSDGNEAEVEGTLSVQPQANPIRGFEEYFLNLTVDNNKRNPWFTEYWEHKFNCKFRESPLTLYNQNYERQCTGREPVSRSNTQFEAQLQFVSDAVMAFAYAFKDMHREKCGEGFRGLCNKMDPVDGTELLKYLRNVQFDGLSGDRFQFDEQGDGPARYRIIHFKQVTRGRYSWDQVGEYIGNQLRLNMSALQFRQGAPSPPSSICSLPCRDGQARKYVDSEARERCCWHCFNCSTYQVVDPGDDTECVTCRLGTLPDVTHMRCEPLPEAYLRADSSWAIGAMSFSAAGIVLTCLVIAAFIRHVDTPVVRASGRELSFVLLYGILLCYAMTFVLVLRPSDVVCGLQQFGIGFCFSVVYSALLTKTNRIARIFNAGKKSAARPHFITPASQLVICSLLILVQLIVSFAWMWTTPPAAMYYHPTPEDNLLVCKASINASYMVGFAYPILLIVVCTVYAVLTRKIPEAFNESKYIGFTMYTTCVIWLAFVPIYFSTANHVALRITTMSVSISLSASIAIACLFTPKLYIILLHPERNVRQSMMSQKYSQCSQVRTNISLSSQQRIDSGTQSDADIELDKLRVCPICSARNNGHTGSPRANLRHQIQYKPMANGPLQNVPDVQL
ncbi:metabotropic glutamate receptor-like [Pollicipes pollicipes]|uniref:metabotropic glutamate receptor-like n=1 Tax=Pollicipes pollicipes TaxID=41117 RepID=UPI00188503D3|nr:metabotropic glutamate receptor-like [Pollicipes pollicipes]